MNYPVVLVPPATGLVNAWKNTHVPVGLLLLATLVRELPGVTVRIYDGPLWFPTAAAADAAAQAVLAEGTALVGVSAWCHTLPAQLTLAEAIKAQAPQVPIVFGGPQATAVDAGLLAESPAVDLVLRGEAEQSFPLLVQRLQHQQPIDDVPGLTQRGPEGTLVRTAPPAPCLDLDALPSPAHDLAPHRPVATVESGRGCPWACRFCSTSAFFARKHRARSAPSLVAELHRLAQRGVRHVTFTDDIFTVDRRQVDALCDALIAQPAALAWGCSTRIDCVTAPLLQRMAAAGCESILFGVETGSARLQRAMGKRLDVSKVEPVVAQTLAAGIRPYCTFIFGFPEGTPEDLAQTLRLIRRLATQGVHVTAQTLAVLPDTPYYHERQSDLRWDGHTSLSRASLTPGEAARARANPALFSSFHYLPSPAAPRETLIRLAQLTNVLRHFPSTARWGRFDAEGDPFAVLVQQSVDPRTAIRHAASIGGPMADAYWRLETTALDQRMRPSTQAAGLCWQGCFAWVSPVGLAREGGDGPFGYLVALKGDHGLTLEPLPHLEAAALAALTPGSSPKVARTMLAEEVGVRAARMRLATLAAQGWLAFRS
jgi:radical SAM superfamily enzyme YgiQ (UPF0313 family)